MSDMSVLLWLRKPDFRPDVVATECDLNSAVKFK
jgi:hypothetical protein